MPAVWSAVSDVPDVPATPKTSESRLIGGLFTLPDVQLAASEKFAVVELPPLQVSAPLAPNADGTARSTRVAITVKRNSPPAEK